MDRSEALPQQDHSQLLSIVGMAGEAIFGVGLWRHKNLIALVAGVADHVLDVDHVVEAELAVGSSDTALPHPAP